MVHGMTCCPCLSTPRTQLILCLRSQAGDDEDDACRLKMEGDPTMWRTLMNEIAPCTGSPGSRDLPDPRSWRDNLRELRKLTGLRRKDFGDDEAHYMKAIARMVSPPGLPDGVVSLPEQFIRPPVVDAVILALQGSVSMEVASHVVLTGMGGVGKTLVASAVARDKSIRRFFSDGVLWIKDRPGDSSAERLLLQLDALARQFEEIVLARHHRQGNTAQQFVDKFDNAQRAQNFFRMWQAKRNLKCLLVVDSAWNRVGVECRNKRRIVYMEPISHTLVDTALLRLTIAAACATLRDPYA